MRRVFIFLLLLIPLIFSFSTNLKANTNKPNFYKPGGVIKVRFLCNDVDRLLEVAEADAYDLDKAAKMMQVLFKFNKCVALKRWFYVSITNVVLAYKDEKQRNTYLLEVYTPEIEPKDVVTKKLLKTYILIMEPKEYLPKQNQGTTL